MALSAFLIVRGQRKLRECRRFDKDAIAEMREPCRISRPLERQMNFTHNQSRELIEMARLLWLMAFANVTLPEPSLPNGGVL